MVNQETIIREDKQKLNNSINVIPSIKNDYLFVLNNNKSYLVAFEIVHTPKVLQENLSSLPHFTETNGCCGLKVLKSVFYMAR